MFGREAATGEESASRSGSITQSKGADELPAKMPRVCTAGRWEAAQESNPTCAARDNHTAPSASITGVVPVDQIPRRDAEEAEQQRKREGENGVGGEVRDSWSKCRYFADANIVPLVPRKYY